MFNCEHIRVYAWIRNQPLTNTLQPYSARRKWKWSR